MVAVQLGSVKYKMVYSLDGGATWNSTTHTAIATSFLSMTSSPNQFLIADGRTDLQFSLLWESGRDRCTVNLKARPAVSLNATEAERAASRLCSCCGVDRWAEEHRAAHREKGRQVLAG